MNTIHIAAAIIINERGETLLVRKRNSDFFMQAGGKIDTGEKPAQALVREIEEELDIEVNADALQTLGQFTEQAANEADHQLLAEMFLLKADFEAHPEAEIAEAVWRTPEQAQAMKLAPLTRNHVMPIVEQYIG